MHLGSAAGLFLLLQTGRYFADSAAVITIETFGLFSEKQSTAGSKKTGEAAHHTLQVIFWAGCFKIKLFLL